MSKNITAREKIEALLKMAKISAKIMNNNSIILKDIKEYEEILKNTDKSIKEYILKKREKVS